MDAEFQYTALSPEAMEVLADKKWGWANPEILTVVANAHTAQFGNTQCEWKGGAISDFVTCNHDFPMLVTAIARGVGGLRN